MIKTPVGALIWENWRQTRGMIAIAVGVSISMCALLVYLDWSSQNIYINPAEIGQWVWAVSLLMLIGVLMFMNSDPTDLRPTLPNRYLTLPMPPGRIALVLLGYRLVVFTVCAYALAAITAVLFNNDDLLSATPFAIAGCSYAVAGVWCLGRFGMLRAASAMLIMGMPVGYAIIVTSKSSLIAPWIWTLAFAAVAYGAARIGITREATSFPWAKLAFQRKDKFHHRNALAAQTWYERSRREDLIRNWWIGASVTLFVLNTIVNLTDQTMATSQLIELFFVLIPIATVVAFLGAGVVSFFADIRESKSGLALFVNTHPLGLPDLAMARVLGSFQAVVRTYAFVLGVAAVTLFLIWVIRSDGQDFLDLGVAVDSTGISGLAVYAILSVVVLWCLYVVPIGLVAIVGVHVVALAIWVGISYVAGRSVSETEMTTMASYLLTATFLGGTVWTVHRLRSHRLIRREGWKLANATWFISAVSILLISFAFDENGPTGIAATAEVITTALVLALVPVECLLVQGVIVEKLKGR